MGYRVYGEPKEEKESPIGSFFLGLFIGVFLYDAGLWGFVSLGWISQLHLRLICCGIGILLGAKMAFSSWRRLKAQQKPRGKNHA